MVSKYRIKLFRFLLEIICREDYRHILSSCSFSIHDLLRLARLNKVELEVALRLGVKDEADRLLDRYNRVMRLSRAISRALKSHGVKFAFFKFLRPVKYVPADLDLLVHADHVRTAIKVVSKLGFQVEVSEPFTVTLRCGEYIVDLYVHPCIAGSVCYLNGNVLLEHVSDVKVDGVNVPCLRPYAEVIVVVAHALYKEHLVTLNDYLTFKKWFSSETDKLSRELRCETAIEYMRGLADLIEHGRVALPYRLPVAHALRLILDKVRKDKLTRSTLLYSVNKLRDRRLLNQIISHFTRETY